MVERKCSEEEYEFEIGSDIARVVKPMCGNYPYGNVKSHFPWWGTLLIVIGSLAVLRCVGFLVCTNMRR